MTDSKSTEQGTDNGADGARAKVAALEAQYRTLQGELDAARERIAAGEGSDAQLQAAMLATVRLPPRLERLAGELAQERGRLEAEEAALRRKQAGQLRALSQLQMDATVAALGTAHDAALQMHSLQREAAALEGSPVLDQEWGRLIETIEAALILTGRFQWGATRDGQRTVLALPVAGEWR